jgi:hypothetical protein
MSIPIDELEAIAALLDELRRGAPTKQVATALQSAQTGVENASYWSRRQGTPTGLKPGSGATAVARPPRRRR